MIEMALAGLIRLSTDFSFCNCGEGAYHVRAVTSGHIPVVPLASQKERLFALDIKYIFPIEGAPDVETGQAPFKKPRGDAVFFGKSINSSSLIAICRNRPERCWSEQNFSFYLGEISSTWEKFSIFQRPFDRAVPAWRLTGITDSHIKKENVSPYLEMAVDDRQIGSDLSLANAPRFLDGVFGRNGSTAIKVEGVPDQYNSLVTYKRCGDPEDRHEPLRVGIIPRVEFTYSGYNPRDIIILGLLYIGALWGGGRLLDWLIQRRNKNNSRER